MGLNFGRAATGAASGAGIGSIVPVIGTGLGALIGGGIGLFSGGRKKPATPAIGAEDDELSKWIASLEGSSVGSRSRANTLSDLSDEQLRPAIDYINKLVSGDAGAIAEATRPERSRVIDQYDAARRMISEFSGRGGGANAALASSRFDQANTLANITADARKSAVNTAANLGTTLEGLGLSNEQLASADLNTIINAVLNKQGLDLSREGLALQERGQNKQLAAGLAEALGTILGLYFTRGKK